MTGGAAAGAATADPTRGLAVAFDHFGDPDVLRARTDLVVPAPGPAQVTIRLEAVSVGYAQTQMRRNQFPSPAWQARFPAVLGGDVVGRIVAVGADLDRSRLDDRVGAFVLEGGYAEHVVVDAHLLVPVPDALDAAEATVLPGTGPIAAGLLDVAGGAAGVGGIAGGTVLIHAAAGGVGHVAVQLAAAAGARVFATARSAEGRRFAAALGAAATFDYSRPDWPDQVRAATGGRGVDIVLDGVGGHVLLQSPRVLAPMGKVIFFGSAGGGADVPPVSPMSLMGLHWIGGFTLSAWRGARPAAYRDAVASMSEDLSTGRLQSSVHARFALRDAASAHRVVEARGHRGRVVLLTAGDGRSIDG